MKRQPLSNGKWFDLDAATKFSEDTRWDGNNHVSLATGSQWDHEALYRTAGKRWVLNNWSQWQGSSETWTEIDDSAAATWLVVNGEEHPDAAEEIASLEI